MPEDLKALALDLARRIKENPEAAGPVITDPARMLLRERIMLVAIHDAIEANSVAPLFDLRTELDIACENACGNATHPDTEPLCRRCDDRCEFDPEDMPEHDYKFDIGTRGQRA